MRHLIKLTVAVLCSALVFSSCNCFKKMAKTHDAIQLACSPEVLELNNGIITANISATVPENYFDKNASVRVTPTIFYEDGYVKGESIVLQGEKVVDNGIVVKSGEKLQVDRTVTFKYIPQMQKCTLKLLVEIKCKSGKCKTYTMVNANTGEVLSESQNAIITGGGAVANGLLNDCGRTIAVGVNTLQKDLNYTLAMKECTNNYKNILTEVVKADIVYKINSANVDKKAMTSNELQLLKQYIDQNIANVNSRQSIYVNGYASPDGPEKKNDDLSQKRSKSGSKALDKFLGNTGIKVDVAAYGEDWDGFREAVAESNIEDKDIILQVLQMYSSSQEREKEIKNLSAVYKTLTTEILPKLRRAQVVNSNDITGKTDAEMAKLIEAGKGNELTCEELLHMAEVKPELAEKALKVACDKYQDARAYNNLAVIYAKQGDLANAKTALDLAASKGLKSQEVNTNYALLALANGETEKAKEYASVADNETKALMAASEGKYTEAEKSLKGYNAALVQVQQGKYAEAKRSLANVDGADAEYLRAVIANKEGNIAEAKAKLQSAINMNPSLAQKAQNDINLENIAKSVNVTR
ncbi:MAG: hypothetical protein KBS95_01230 [Alistipes sp.]|nr:hypothetical protein [Candidatus Alistipes equi]